MIPETTLVHRLTGRRICDKCGEPFHVLFMPPKEAGVCDRCSGALIQRSDDKEDVVKRRLQVFGEQNTQLLNYYGREKKLRELDADRPVETLQSDLLRLLQ